jgi:2-polyprenyl-3-methyl-5-hydroxy-6-metoxy-1,4-benzoquinol methylase
MKTRNTTDQELLDGPNLSAEELHQNMAELDVINRWLGGHHTTLAGLELLMTDKTKTYTIIDIGCGGGDMLKIIADWAQSKNYKVNLLGLDNNKDILDYAKQHTPKTITYLLGNFQDLPDLAPKPDILISALFMHHLFDKSLFQLLWMMGGYQKVGFVINDLHRHPLAYWSIKILTALFSKSRLVKHDAALSVARGFNKTELEDFFTQAKIGTVSIKWSWAFRWLIVGKNAYHR